MFMQGSIGAEIAFGPVTSLGGEEGYLASIVIHVEAREIGEREILRVQVKLVGRLPVAIRGSVFFIIQVRHAGELPVRYG
jgi:hypothetical protein